jgi:tagatose 1,6-diphosphate aldolase
MTLLMSLGKIRLLQQCSTARGALSVLALDHRGNLRQLLRPASPQDVSDEELVNFKQLVVRSLAPAASARLLDPQFSAAQSIASGDMPGRTGLVVALEATGYESEPTARISRVLPGWSVEKARRMGANAIKLLVYYHPDSPAASQMEQLVQQVAADCARHEMPMFLEVLSYSLDPTMKKLPSDELHYVVIETAQRLTPLGGDILKAEFPLDVTVEKDETAWLQACLELSRASQVPWVLLSGSSDYDTFLRQVTVACRAGASGVAVGRAVWRETTSLKPEERPGFLVEVAYERMRRITGLVDALAKPWLDFYEPPQVNPEWFIS